MQDKRYKKLKKLFERQIRGTRTVRLEKGKGKEDTRDLCHILWRWGKLTEEALYVKTCFAKETFVYNPLIVSWLIFN